MITLEEYKNTLIGNSEHTAIGLAIALLIRQVNLLEEKIDKINPAKETDNKEDSKQ